MGTFRGRFSVSPRVLAILIVGLLAISLSFPRAVTLGQGSSPTAQATECASVTDSSTTVKIGAVVPLTGRYASGGEQIQNGYQLAVADINGADGVVVACQRMKLD